MSLLSQPRFGDRTMKKLHNKSAVPNVSQGWKNDCSALPFSRKKAEALTELSESSRPQQLVDLLGRKQIRVRELTGNPILHWPISLSPLDARGLKTGPSYESWHKAQVGRTGLSGNFFGIKSGRHHPVHSALEARLRASFDMCPYVLDIRTQYPSWDKAEYERYFLQGRKFPKNRVMTIDFMLTLLLPGETCVQYHGVSGKPRRLMDEPAVISRHAREVLQLGEWGCTHEVLDEHAVSYCEYANYCLLKSWLLWTDIGRCSAQSAEFAGLVGRSSITGHLDRVLTVLGRRLGHSLEQAYRLFAVAAFLGYLQLDYRFRLQPSMPLCLNPAWKEALNVRER